MLVVGVLKLGMETFGQKDMFSSNKVIGGSSLLSERDTKGPQISGTIIRANISFLY